MTVSSVSRRDSLRNIAALGLAGTAIAFGATVPAAAAQPAMRNALNDLDAALRALQHGLPDKGGHRVKAIALVKEAIDEVKAGIVAGAM